MRKNIIFALLVVMFVGCSSQQSDEPDYTVPADDEAIEWPIKWDLTSKVDMSAVMQSAGLVDYAEAPQFYKDENGLWYPIDPKTRITYEEMHEKIMGYGWENIRAWQGYVDRDGIYHMLFPDGNMDSGVPYATKYAFYPGFIRKYDYRYWDHGFFYHDDSKLDTDAPIIGYSSTDDRDCILPIKLIGDGKLVVLQTNFRYLGNGVYEPTGIAACYVLRRASADELAKWEERHTVDYWGN